MLKDKLIDIIEKEVEVKDDDPRKSHLPSLRISEYFKIDNVAQYLISLPDDKWTHDLFPNIAPVFPFMFFEWHQTDCGNVRCGVFLYSAEIPLGGFDIGFLEPLETPLFISYGQLGYSNGQGYKAKWLSQAVFFMEMNDGYIKEIGHHLYLVSEEGKKLNFKNNKKCLYQVYDTRLSSGFESFFVPAFVTLTFLHCKNVHINKQVIPERLQKARIKHGKSLLFDYHLLEIKPIKQILDKEGNVNKTGIKMALHICRGHFKDFSKSNGLFGKYKGFYWWDAQLKGSHLQGVRLKDYNVHRPSLS